MESLQALRRRPKDYGGAQNITEPIQRLRWRSKHYDAAPNIKEALPTLAPRGVWRIVADLAASETPHGGRLSQESTLFLPGHCTARAGCRRYIGWNQRHKTV